MTPQELALVLLQNKRDDLVARLSRVEHDRQRGEQALSADSEERSIECENDEVLDRLAEATTQELAQVRRALDQMDRGRYGICSICEQPITHARLRAMPEATECGPCALQSSAAAKPSSALAT